MTNYECENRISDDEIISSLEVIATTRTCSECKIRNCNWGDCNCSQITANAALDLINRQKAEIDSAKAKIEICAEVIKRQDAEIKRLKECPKCVYEYDGEVTEYCIQGPCPNFKPVYVSADLSIKQIKNEAYKEFAERLKKETLSDRGYDILQQGTIDNLLKEMVGERRITDNQEAEKALEKMK